MNRIGLIRKIFEARIGLENEGHADDEKRAARTSAEAFLSEHAAIAARRKDAGKDKAARVFAAVATLVSSVAECGGNQGIADAIDSSGIFATTLFGSKGDGSVADARAAAAKRVAEAARADARSSDAAVSSIEERLREVMRNLHARA